MSQRIVSQNIVSQRFVSQRFVSQRFVDGRGDGMPEALPLLVTLSVLVGQVGVGGYHVRSTTDVCSPRVEVGNSSTRAWMPKMFPHGARYLVGGCPGGNARLPHWACTRCLPPSDFGVDNAWVPFAHTRDRRRPSIFGLWYYYAEGCSDVEVHVGRTLLARNRVHAAIRLTQLLGPVMHPGAPKMRARSESITDQEAIARIAAWVHWHDPYWKTPRRSLMSMARETKNVSARETLMWSVSEATLRFLFAEVARGIYSPPPPGRPSHFTKWWRCLPGPQYNQTTGSLIPCACDDQRPPWLGRAQGLAPLSGDPVLDTYLLAVVRHAGQQFQLAAIDAVHDGPLVTPLPIDTVQLYEQPQGSGSTKWTMEMWDLRTILLPTNCSDWSVCDQEPRRNGRVGFHSEPDLLARLSRRYIRQQHWQVCETGPASGCLVCNASEMQALMSPRQIKECAADPLADHFLSG